MKKIVTLIMMFGLLSSVLLAQTDKIKKDPTGKWTFDAPYAPYGYNTGTTDIGYENDVYTVKMTFAESGYSFTGENVLVRNDSLLFQLWIEGTPINMGIAVLDKSDMSGAAVYFEGTVPFTLKKVTEKEE